MGDRDEFTSESQLQAMLAKARRGTPLESVIYPGVGHFELESPAFDEQVSATVLEWIDKQQWRG